MVHCTSVCLEKSQNIFGAFFDTLISDHEFSGIVLFLLSSKLGSCCFIYCIYKSSWKQPHWREACEVATDTLCLCASSLFKSIFLFSNFFCFFFYIKALRSHSCLFFTAFFLYNVFQTRHKTFSKTAFLISFIVLCSGIMSCTSSTLPDI